MSDKTIASMATSDETIGTLTSNSNSSSSSSASANTDTAVDKANSQPVVSLAASLTCPDCGLVNKAEWLSKARNGDIYVTTMFCSDCGCMMAVWASRVGVRVIAHKQEY